MTTTITPAVPTGKYRKVGGEWFATTTDVLADGAIIHLVDSFDRTTVATIGTFAKAGKDGARYYTFTTEKLSSADRTAKRAETLKLRAERANSPEGLRRATEQADRIDARLAAKAAAAPAVVVAPVIPSAPAIDPTGVLAGLDPAVLAALLALVTPAASTPAAVTPPAAPVKPRAPKAPAAVKNGATECAACGKPRVSIHLGCKLPVCAACFTADTDTVVKRAMRRANLAK